MQGADVVTGEEETKRERGTSLYHLPDTSIFNVLAFLQRAELAPVACTSKILQNVADDSRLWARLDFSDAAYELTEQTARKELDIATSRFDSPRLDKHQWPAAFPRGVTVVSFQNCFRVTDANVRQVADTCPQLQEFTLTGTVGFQVTWVHDHAIVHLAQSCKHLKRLELSKLSRLTDAGLAEALRAPHLQETLEQLTIKGCLRLQSPDTVAVLRGLSALRSLSLSGCGRLPNEGFLRLFAAPDGDERVLPNLADLTLNGMLQLEDGAVSCIIECVGSHLNLLNLASCRKLTNASAFAISSLGDDDEPLLSKLSSLSLSGCRRIGDVGATALARSLAPQLRLLGISGTSIEKPGLDALVPTLECVQQASLKGLCIGDSHLTTLAAGSQALTEVILGGRYKEQYRAITDAGVAAIVNRHAATLDKLGLCACANVTLAPIALLLNATTHIGSLDLRGTAVNFTAVLQLLLEGKCSLDELYLDGADVTKELRAQIAERLPMTVYYDS